MSDPIRTKTVGTISTVPGLGWLFVKHQGIDLIEVRLDLIGSVPHLDKILACRSTPVILTLRLDTEGGRWPHSKSRYKLFKNLLPYADGIDIEVSALDAPETGKILGLAKRKIIILSTHFLERPIQPVELSYYLARFAHLFPHPSHHYLKVATYLRSKFNMDSLAKELTKQHVPIALMGIGPLAATSRKFFTTAGSRLLYGYLDKPSVIGQPRLRFDNPVI